MYQTPLIATIVVGLVLAFALGALAQRLRVSPLVGYLLAGVAIGPFTPGFVADQASARDLAEIGVILLMFGVGLHFSLKDLLSVWVIAVPGSLAQIALATLLGMALAWPLGWPVASGFVFGLALSVASTVVVLRALQERKLIDTERGRIAVGWLIVEDIVMVFALVLLPAMATILAGDGAAGSRLAAFGSLGLGGILALTVGKLAAFVALMLVVGRRIIPWLLHYIAHTGSRELFRLAVLSVALGAAYGAAALFDVSFALGAFFAGMILSESPLSKRAAEESLPLRDAFAVLFFVSVGMLFDPRIVLREPWLLLATLGIIMIGKPIAGLLIVRILGRPPSTALLIAASRAQIGEFSFILAGLGVSLALLPEMGRDLILAGSILSILLNPLAFMLAERVQARLEAATGERAAAGPAEPAPELPITALTDHTILVGYGRVGGMVGAGLKAAGQPFLVIEVRPDFAEVARRDGAEVIVGNAADPAVLKAANPALASRIILAIPEAFEAGQIVAQARAANPGLRIVARAHSDAEVEHLTKHGASLTIMGEREIARGMLEDALGPVPPTGSTPMGSAGGPPSSNPEPAAKAQEKAGAEAGVNPPG
ncbi:MAG: YbaL family putative K(+) efflux transporter [Pseudomonadota bacterium]